MNPDRTAPGAHGQPDLADGPDLSERLSADLDGSLAFSLVKDLHARASALGKLSDSDRLHRSDIYAAYIAAAEIVEQASLELRARRPVR